MSRDRSSSPVVGIAFDIHAPWFEETLAGVADYADEHGPWTLTQPLTERGAAIGGPQAEMLDGLLVQQARGYEALIDAGIPVVQLGGWNTPPIEGAPHVAADVRRIGSLVAEYFAERGLRCLAAWAGGERASRLKVSAFCRRGRALGCRVAVFGGGGEQHVGLAEQLQAFGEWLRAMPKPIGLMGGNERRSWAAVSACQLAGLSVPDQVAIVAGGEDARLFEHTRPAISSVQQDTHAIGWTAASLLDRWMSGETDLPSETLVLPLGIVERASTDIYAYDDADVVAALRYIWDNVAAGVTIESVLERVPVSASTLTRKFRRVLGRTPAEEIKRSRVETARRLVASTEMPLAEVAVASGLGSQSLLSRYLKEATGHTPRALRQAHRPPVVEVGDKLVDHHPD